MRVAAAILLVTLSVTAYAAKPHSVTLGRPMPVKLMVGASEEQAVDITVRTLNVDGKVKEFTTGDTHDVTDREFVVRRAYRINDNLPEESRKPTKWLWQRGAWLLVNRTSGKVTPLRLPEFDLYYSDVSWYRDYAAYCGISASGEKVTAVVAEVGTAKPLFRRELGSNPHGDAADSNCAAPTWGRQPSRVTFQPKSGEKFTVNVSGHFADAAAVERESDE